jgi:hypothetical protein
MKATRIRPGLYQAGQYMVEQRYTMTGWAWQVTNTENFSDPRFGDYATKREAIEAIEAIK